MILCMLKDFEALNFKMNYKEGVFESLNFLALENVKKYKRHLVDPQIVTYYSNGH
jgi:hypothetical protein